MSKYSSEFKVKLLNDYFGGQFSMFGL